MFAKNLAVSPVGFEPTTIGLEPIMITISPEAYGPEEFDLLPRALP